MICRLGEDAGAHFGPVRKTSRLTPSSLQLATDGLEICPKNEPFPLSGYHQLHVTLGRGPPFLCERSKLLPSKPVDRDGGVELETYRIELEPLEPLLLCAPSESVHPPLDLFLESCLPMGHCPVETGTHIDAESMLSAALCGSSESRVT